MKKKHLLLLKKLHDGNGDGTKHARLSNCLRQAIENGVLKPGERLPTEVELVAATPFSLGTIQRAVRSLVEAGLVQRTPKRGTFVAHPHRRIDEPWHFRFLEADRKTLLPVYPTVVSRLEIRQRGPWNDFINGRVLRIDRVVNVNDEFLAYSRFFLDGSKFPAFEKAPIDSLHGENFRMLLNRQIQEPIQRIHQRLSVGTPSPQISRAIEIEDGAICAIVEIAASGSADNFIYYQELTVPPSDRRLALADPVILSQA